MGTGISIDQLKTRRKIGWRSKHTQYDRTGRPVGSNTIKGKRAF